MNCRSMCECAAVGGDMKVDETPRSVWFASVCGKLTGWTPEDYMVSALCSHSRQTVTYHLDYMYVVKR